MRRSPVDEEHGGGRPGPWAFWCSQRYRDAIRRTGSTTVAQRAASGPGGRFAVLMEKCSRRGVCGPGRHHHCDHGDVRPLSPETATLSWPAPRSANGRVDSGDSQCCPERGALDPLCVGSMRKVLAAIPSGRGEFKETDYRQDVIYLDNWGRTDRFRWRCSTTPQCPAPINAAAGVTLRLEHYPSEARAA